MPIYQLKLISRREVARNTIEYHFEKPTGFNFIPGQYGGFTLVNPPLTDAAGITRRFSLLSTPDDNDIAIVTRIQSSAFKQVLKDMPLQSIVKFAGPTGNFVLHNDIPTPAVFIAGGIGIVPFYSIIKHACRHLPQQKMILFYGNQQVADAAYLTDFIELQQQHPSFTFVPTMADADTTWQGECGYVTDSLIRKYVKDIHAPIYYICGSGGMVAAIRELLVEMGIEETNIRVEDFPGY